MASLNNANQGYKLVDEKTGEELKIGEVYQTFRGESVNLTGWTAPAHSASTGRVYVKAEAGWEQGYFPSVIGAKIVEVEDGE